MEKKNFVESSCIRKLSIVFMETENFCSSLACLGEHKSRRSLAEWTFLGVVKHYAMFNLLPTLISTEL